MESSGKGTKPKKEGVDPATLPPFEHWRQLISSILGRKRKPPLLSEQETIQLIVNSSHQSKQSSIEAVVKVLPPFMGEKHEVGFALHRVLEALVNSDEESFRILDMLFQSYIDRVTQGTHLQADQEVSVVFPFLVFEEPKFLPVGTVPEKGCEGPLLLVRLSCVCEILLYQALYCFQGAYGH